MKPRMKLNIFQCVLVVLNGLKANEFDLHHDEETEGMLSPALNACKMTGQSSKIQLFHVLSLNADFPVQSFIQTLHENSIDTILITHQRWLKKTVVGHQPKNIFIHLNSLDEVLGFILDSVSQSASEFDEDSGWYVENATMLKKPGRYCVEEDEKFAEIEKIDVRKTCDFELHISDAELNGVTDLTDSIFKETAGLMMSNIWTSINYIIFMLPKFGRRGKSVTFDREDIDENRLLFLFRFFWRFFRGLHTVICAEYVCFKYDPFARSMLLIDTRSGNSFPPISLQGEKFVVGMVQKRDLLRHSNNAPVRSLNLMSEVVGYVAQELKTPIEVNAYCLIGEDCDGDTDEKYYEIALRSNLDMLIFQDSISPYETDFTKFDFSAGFQTCSQCFAAPRSALIPPYLLPFKTFSPQVWAATLTTVLGFYIMFCLFNFSQRTLFKRLYGEVSLREFQNSSVTFILFSFFFVGCPCRPLLGRVFTGKLLFTITSFFVLVIVTAFQSQFTTLLAALVRYPEIDTLEALMVSDLSIQTGHSNTSAGLFRENNAARNKLTESYVFYQKLWLDVLLKASKSYNDTSELWHLGKNYGDVDPFLKKASEIHSNMLSIMESDAFEVSVLTLNQDFQGNFKATGFYTQEIIDYHLVKECILTHAMTFRCPKNSFLSGLIFDKLLSFTESGLGDDATRAAAFFNARRSWILNNEETRPRCFTMQNLQSAFLGLLLGWIVSCIVFAIELAVDVYQTYTNKFMRFAVRIIRPPSLWA
ncbi:unnamed protein product [Bemisia tabaci]|uniref:Ionotropic receptor n=1 Tax=Bemisia tabaci TaxID=7038 RepID=A0A9P0A305_BEMTA|nr:unnamed protein product [Bemisia tabaci]